MKYKLIKKYPTSPEVGTVIHNHYSKIFISENHPYNIEEKDILPEYWAKYVFTSEDGVDLFVGDRYFPVPIKDISHVKAFTITNLNAICQDLVSLNYDHINYKFFSTEKAAKDYLESLKKRQIKDSDNSKAIRVKKDNIDCMIQINTRNTIITKEQTQKAVKLAEEIVDNKLKPEIGKWYKHDCGVIALYADTKYKIGFNDDGTYADNWEMPIEEFETNQWKLANPDKVKELFLNECKRRFPIGCKIKNNGLAKSSKPSKGIINNHNFRIELTSIWVNASDLYGIKVFENGIWAEVEQIKYLADEFQVLELNSYNNEQPVSPNGKLFDNKEDAEKYHKSLLKANTGKFKIGDKIKVIRKCESFEGNWIGNWVENMDDSVNNTFIIKQIYINYGYKLAMKNDKGHFYFPEFVLELVESPLVKIDDKFIYPSDLKEDKIYFIRGEYKHIIKFKEIKNNYISAKIDLIYSNSIEDGGNLYKNSEATTLNKVKQFREATKEEILWLETCEKNNKFIPYEDVFLIDNLKKDEIYCIEDETGKYIFKFHEYDRYKFQIIKSCSLYLGFNKLFNDSIECAFTKNLDTTIRKATQEEIDLLNAYKTIHNFKTK